MVDVLLKLKEQGKFLFMASNATYEFVELSMSTTLGKDWKKCFNMVWGNCGKPEFFKYETDKQMF